MPSRPVCLILMLYWAIAASSLIQRDILPELGFVRAPDFRLIASAEIQPTPSTWSMEVLDDAMNPNKRRVVGTATTFAQLQKNGQTEITSTVNFEPSGFLRGTPLSKSDEARLVIESRYLVDANGNLQTFKATVHSPNDPEELVSIDGKVEDRKLKIVSRGHIPFLNEISFLNQTRVLDYAPRDLLQSAMGPFDRMPGLQIGQRWTTRVVSPLTGRVQSVEASVKRRCVIHWGQSPVSVLEVVHEMTPISAKTWVRPDGLVLRQEVPFPFAKIVLERIPDLQNPSGLEVPGR